MIGQVIAHDDFRPVNHRSFDELQGMFAESQLIAFLDSHITVRHGCAEKLFKQFERLGLADNFGIRIFFQQCYCRAGMIRFHVLQDKIIKFAAMKQIFNIFQEFITAAFVHGIDDAGLFVINEIGVVRNSFRNRENPFK